MHDLREEAGLTQAQLAERFPTTKRGDRSSNWISDIEAGAGNVTLDVIEQMALALNVSVGYLVLGEASGDSEFIARIKGMELRLDRRGRNAVIAIAEQQVADKE